MRWGSFSVYEIKLHLLCSNNRVPRSYELTDGYIAEGKLTEELLAGADLGGGPCRGLSEDLVYRSEALREMLATTLVGLVTRVAAKVCAYAYVFLVNCGLG